MILPLRLSPFLFLAAGVFARIPSRRAADDMITTNRERLARNLPPLPPKFGRTLPGSQNARGVDDPTHVEGIVPRASPSAYPPPPSLITYTGRIEVQSSHGDNSTIGFFNNTSGGMIGVYNGTGEELHVTFSTTASGKGPFDIIAENPKITGPVYLGGKTTNSSPILSAESGTTVDLALVEQTPPRSRPVKRPTGFEESSIWSIDPKTKQITPHWINPDGSPAPTEIVYDIQKNAIFFTGNLDVFNKYSGNNTSTSLVKFFLASD